MRGKRFVYGSYRGRRSTTDVLKTVALILAVLVVLAVAGVWMAQKYIVYDDGGYHLELPFFQKEPGWRALPEPAYTSRCRGSNRCRRPDRPRRSMCGAG